MKSAAIAVAALALLGLPCGCLLSEPAHAQIPNVNLMPEVHSKTPEEKEADEVRDKAYRDSLKKIPDAKTSNDPWGAVRSDAAKGAGNAGTSGSRAAGATKKTKTGSTN